MEETKLKTTMKEHKKIAKSVVVLNAVQGKAGTKNILEMEEASNDVNAS